jgi:pimeloyl-ACP methyl ester carboxylesterase/DNA-binding CsgD family transcriptional regulator
MKQQIRFTHSYDGVRIAYATSGSGPPLVKAANWLSHLEFDWHSPVWNPWLTELSRDHTYVRYDARGCGLSDRDIPEYSVEAWARDLEAVVDALGLERFPLLGLSQGAAVGMTYAVRHPERVSHLIFCGGYARGRLKRPGFEPALADTMVQLAKIGWGKDNPAFHQFFTSFFIPDGTLEQLHWWNDLQRVSMSPEDAVRFLHCLHEIDVMDLVPQVRTPSLILHARGDASVPFEEGRVLASLIPGARFVPLESRNHILLSDEPAWPVFLAEVRDFLKEGQSPPACFPDLTERELEVLDLIAQGLGNGEIAERLVISPSTLRNHITSIFSKLQVAHRAQAIVLARDAGLGQHRSG